MIRLRYENLSLTVSGRPILDSIDLDLVGPGIVILLGPSGAGKSSLLKATQRLVEGGRDGWSRSGDIRLHGRSIFDGPRRELTRRVGYIQQAPAMLAGSVRANVEFGLKYSGTVPRRKVRPLAEEALERVGLARETPLEGPAATLSGGQQQRLAIARAIALEPEVFLMDEPTSALDPISSLQVEKVIQDLARERLVVMVTHKVALASRIGHFAGFLLRGPRGGRVAEFGALPGVLRTASDEGARHFIESGAIVDLHSTVHRHILHMTFLFVCFDNTSRSPLAEAVCRDEIAYLLGGGHPERRQSTANAISAGLAAVDGRPLQPAAQRALANLGLPGSQHSSRQLTPEHMQRADVIFCMTRHQCRTLAGQFPHCAGKIQPLDPVNDLEDPGAGGFDFDVELAGRIKELVRWRLQAVSQYPEKISL